MASPKLRFKEFDGKWSLTSLNQLSTKIGDGIHATPKYDENGIIPFINGNNLVNGKILINENTKRISAEEFQKYNQILSDRTLFLSINGTIGNLAFYKNEKVLLGKSVCFINLKDDIDDKFVYLLLQSPQLTKTFNSELTGTTIKNLSLATVRNSEFYCPSVAEQTKIASFLSAVDEKISLLTKKHELLSQYKQGMMQKLFSQQIRFKADDGSEFGTWEEIILSDVAKRVTRKNKEDNQNALTISAQMGLVNQQDYFTKQIASRDLSKYYLLYKGEFAYNKSYSAGYPMGAIKRLKLYEKGVVSTLYICFSLNPEIDSDFFEHYVESGSLVPELEKIAQEGARNHGLLNISLQEFFEVALLKPCLEEQTKIANFLSSIDQKIEVVAQQIEQAKQWKKGLLQQMFV